MQKLGLNEIREKYLSFFESKGHLRMPSFPLVPKNDPTLLLINAGMAPLKPYFTGEETPPSKRVTTCQKCIRTLDIERVGKTSRHGTFFEMLGNFSFGDYFKKDTTKWAWEFVTDILEIPKDRIWISVYEEDDEAKDIWINHVGIKPDRIVKLGKDDNFWEIETGGPCGPCSEIYFDRGADVGCGSPDCAVGCDCDRFVEVWNLVFTQYDKDGNGVYYPLKNPNIDTGMGLERMACVMQGVNSLFEVDTVKRLLERVTEMTGVKYGEKENKDISVRIITDHIRSAVFLTCDGVLPSNEGRGYVFRRLLRRALRHAWLLGLEEPFLYKLSKVVIGESKDAYPELTEKTEYIEKIIKIEEERFLETIAQGLSIVSGYIDEMKNKGLTQLNGEKAFRLYDTYGFPIDLTRELLEEENFSVEEKTFDELMQNQRETARAARGSKLGTSSDEDVFKEYPPTNFEGYNNFEGCAKVLAAAISGTLIESASQGDKVDIIFDTTVFYAESGGQIGDSGEISSGKSHLKVLDTHKQNGRFIHKCEVLSGEIKVGEKVKMKIDTAKRKAIIRNHSAAHLLQQALKNVLGSHVAQAGSHVSEDRIRFDFSHFSALTPDEVFRVEQEVNREILNNLAVSTLKLSIDEARKMGALALFGEKYGDIVRVVKMGDYSMELCGGCHVTNTAEIGLFKLVSESGVAAGVRRIEGVTGLGVLKLLSENGEIMQKLAGILKTAAGDVAGKAENLMEELKNAKREIESLKGKIAQSAAVDITENAEDIKGIKVITARLDDGLDMDALRSVGDNLKQKYEQAVIVLASAVDNKVNLVAMVTKEAVKKGVHAGNIICEVAKITGGGGGGKPDSANAGGRDVNKIEQALSLVKDLI